MRNTILVFVLIVSGCLTAQAQTLRMDQVPKVAQHNFRTKYPSAQQESWEQVAKDTYQVGFFNGKKRQTARFDGTGKWLETETDVQFSQVPGAVSRAVSKEFPGFDVQIISQIESPDQTEMTYEVVLFKGKENYDVTFSAKGAILKKEAGSPNE